MSCESACLHAEILIHGLDSKRPNNLSTISFSLRVNSTYEIWNNPPGTFGAQDRQHLEPHNFHHFLVIVLSLLTIFKMCPEMMSFHFRDYFGPKGCLQRDSGRLKMHASKNIHSSIWSTILGCPASRLLFLHVCGLWPQDWQPKTYWVCLGTKGMESILVLQGLYSPSKKSRILQ